MFGPNFREVTPQGVLSLNASDSFWQICEILALQNNDCTQTSIYNKYMPMVFLFFYSFV